MKNSVKTVSDLVVIQKPLYYKTIIVLVGINPDKLDDNQFKKSYCSKACCNIRVSAITPITENNKHCNFKFNAIFVTEIL